ncbi:uncharacterized protein V2V93DRAFT_363418 [Kockiozyma suomiensis]|uniref:uncharacterized protein n=1 Tax=Kockiozyma suomiensis TaxID=1337062 RepID=UPI0033442D90
MSNFNSKFPEPSKNAPGTAAPLAFKPRQVARPATSTYSAAPVISRPPTTISSPPIASPRPTAATAATASRSGFQKSFATIGATSRNAGTGFGSSRPFSAAASPATTLGSPTVGKPQNVADQANIAQQQMAYIPEHMKKASLGSSTSAVGGVSSGVSHVQSKQLYEVGADGKRITVIREGGGRKWEDPTLLEWDPSHFRLFVGNLGGDVADDAMLKAFQKYPSVSKAKVIREKSSGKTKGYGFVAFKDPDDYFRAFKEMNGKYIGSHPILLRKANTEIKSKTVKGNKPYEKATDQILKASLQSSMIRKKKR